MNTYMQALLQHSTCDNLSKAEAMYQRSIALLPTDASVLANYGHLLYEHKHDYSNAESAYHKALR
jgi:Tfp pilus assembly protein PilF